MIIIIIVITSWVTNYSLKCKSHEPGMWKQKRNIFSFEYFEYFQPKVGRKKRILSLGRKNILIKKECTIEI